MIQLGKKTKSTKKKDTKKMFQATVDNPRKVQLIFEVASYLVDDIILVINNRGISITAIDANHVGMLLVELPKTFFSKYRCNEELEWGISILDITKILKRSKKDDTLELSHNEDQEDYLAIRIIAGKRKRSFKLRRKTSAEADEDEEVQEQIRGFENTLKDNLKGMFQMETDFLMDIIKDAEIIQELININMSEDRTELIFYAQETTGESEAILNLKDDYIDKYEIEGDCFGSFSIEYILNALKMQSVVDNFTMRIGQDQPLLIEAPFIRDTEKLATGKPGRFVYILAPRVGGEEDVDDYEDEDGDITDEEIAELEKEEESSDAEEG